MVPFGYGDTEKHILNRYILGEGPRWGESSIGVPGRRKVVVSGVGGPCFHCGAKDIHFALTLENDRFSEIRALKEEAPALAKEGFIVVEE